MSHPWDPSISSLQRRALAAGGLDMVGKVALPASVFALVYLGLSTASPWARFFAPWVAGLVALLLIGAATLGVLRARHTEVYLAKWIDKQSGLDDRLSSAVEWSRLQTLDPFQHRCMEQLALQLNANHWSLVLPRTRPERWPITLAALLVIGLTPVVFLRRPSAAIERDARTKAVLTTPVAKTAAKDALALNAEAKASQDLELEKISTELGDLLQNIDQGKTTREDSFRQLERIRAQISRDRSANGAIAKLSGSTDPGAVGALARALASGDRAAAEAALGALSSALANEALTPQELDELRPNLQALADLAKTTPGAAKILSEKLEGALQQMAAGDQPGAAKQLGEVQKGLQSLDKSLASIAAIRKAERTVQQVTRALEGAGEAAEASGMQAAGAGAPSFAPPDVSNGGGKAGLGERSEERGASGPAAPSAGPELTVKGAWNGKVMRQFFDSSNSAGSTDEVKKLLVEHERVVTNRLDRDEIPLEYQDAVRSYFAALHRKGK